MYLIQPQLHTRRAFLRRSAQLAATGVALPTALNLAAMGEAAAQTATDYKALVCVFLYGGNDYANTVVTYDDPSYDLYNAIRGGGAGQSRGVPSRRAFPHRVAARGSASRRRRSLLRRRRRRNDRTHPPTADGARRRVSAC